MEFVYQKKRDDDGTALARWYVCGYRGYDKISRKIGMFITTRIFQEETRRSGSMIGITEAIEIFLEWDRVWIDKNKEVLKGLKEDSWKIVTTRVRNDGHPSGTTRSKNDSKRW